MIYQTHVALSLEGGGGVSKNQVQLWTLELGGLAAAIHLSITVSP